MKTNKEKPIKNKNKSISGVEQRSFLKTLKNRIYGLNKVLAIVGFLVIAGAILAIGGIVEVKDGQLNVTDSMFVDTSTLYVDSSNNKVGIGTTSPGKELEVAGRINGTELNISGNANLAYGSGNVGIGTTSPSEKLNVSGNVGISGNLTVGGNSGLHTKIGYATKNMTNTSESTSYTGLGFRPKAIQISAAARSDDDYNMASTGWSDGTTQYQGGDTNVIIKLMYNSIGQTASLTSLDEDGFTLSWTKIGAPTGKGNFTYLAFG